MDGLAGQFHAATHPPALEKAQAILPSTFIQDPIISSSQKRFIFHESTPMFVGLPRRGHRTIRHPRKTPLHTAYAHLCIRHQRSTFPDKLGHLLHVAGGVEEDEDFVHFNFDESSTACLMVLRCQV